MGFFCSINFRIFEASSNNNTHNCMHGLETKKMGKEYRAWRWNKRNYFSACKVKVRKRKRQMKITLLGAGNTICWGETISRKTREKKYIFCSVFFSRCVFNPSANVFRKRIFLQTSFFGERRRRNRAKKPFPESGSLQTLKWPRNYAANCSRKIPRKERNLTGIDFPYKKERDEDAS